MARLINKDDGGTRGVKTLLVANSAAIKVGAFIYDNAGFASPATASTRILGMVTGFLNKSGSYLDSVSGATGISGTYVSKLFTAASNNQTVDLVKVEYVPVREGDKLLVDLSAAKGTTTGSDLAGYYLRILASDPTQLDESTATTSTTSAQFITNDPNKQGSTTQVIVECVFRQTNV